MPDATPRLALPLLQAAQAQKEITHNEALLLLDALAHAAIEEPALNTPPSAPAAGQMWLAGATPTGAWSGQAGKLALFCPGGWLFIAPKEGMVLWVKSTGVFIRYVATSWTSGDWPVSALKVGGVQVIGARGAAIADPTGGATVDSQSRAAIGQILAAMRAHGLIG
jgi:hypothetical protein